MAEEAISILKGQITDLKAKIKDLEKDNKTQRDELRTANESLETRDKEIAELKKTAVKEGELVLNKADAQRWDIAKAEAAKVGGFDKLQNLSTERDDALAQVASKERNELIKQAGYDVAKFSRLFGDAPLSLTEGDNPTLELTIKDGESEKKVSISDHAETEGITDLLNASKLSPETPQNRAFPKNRVGSSKNLPDKQQPSDSEVMEDRRADNIYN